MKTKIILGVLALVGLMMGSAYGQVGYTIDGDLSDWGLSDLYTKDWSLESTWLPNSGVYFQVEDNHNPNHASDPSIIGPTSPTGVHLTGVGSSYSFYDELPVYHKDGYFVSEPYGSEIWDIEAIYFDQDTSYIYVAVVLGLKADGGGDLRPGDLALDLDRNLNTGEYGYEYGVKIGTNTGLVQFGIYSNPDWEDPNYIPMNRPSVILSGTKTGDVNGAYVDSTISDNGETNYIIEMAIPKSAVGGPGTVSLYDLYLSEGCGNEGIPAPEFPIPITAALLLVSPAFAYLIVKKRKG